MPDSVRAELADQFKKEQTGRGRDSRHVQALDEGRSEHNRTYLNADGTKSLVMSAQATSFQDADGNWQDVDTALEQDGATGKWHSKANAWQAVFGDITQDGVQVTKAGQAFSFVPVDGKSAKPVVTGNAPDQTVTYKNVWQGVDLQYQVRGSELKESIIIKSKVAQSSFDFIAKGANLSPVPGREGAFMLDGAFAGFGIDSATVNTTDGKSVGEMPSIGQTAADGTIHVSLDAGWLASQANASFPVIIDPTLTYNPTAPADYWNFSSTGTGCHGSVACGGQGVGNQGGTTNTRFVFQANLSSIPLTPKFFPLGASLHLELKSGTTSNQSISVDHSTCQTGFSCYDTAWGTSTGTVGSITDLDITNVMIGAMWAGATQQPWFMVHGDETANSSSYKLFDDTKTAITILYENLPNLSNRVDPSPADVGVSITTQPTFFAATSTDPDGDNPVLYRFVIGTSKSVPAYNPYNLTPSVSGVVADSGPSASTQWTVPDNVLQDGTTYYWQVSVRDSLSGYSSPEEYSAPYSFRIDLRNGKDSTQSFDAIGPVNVDLANGNLTTNAQTHTISAVGGSLGLNLDYNSPQVSRRGLVGSYYNYSGSPVFPTDPSVSPNLQRVDPNVNFSWGLGSPYTGIVNQDHFLARWDGYFVAPRTATYQFGTSSDDGSRIFLNGDYSTAYLDQWGTLPNNMYGSGVALTVGQIYPIRYEYYENTGSATAQLLVKTTDNSITPNPIDTAWLQTGVRPVATPHGLVGRYYTDPGTHAFPAQDDPTRLFLTRTDTSMSQDWGSGSPVPGGPSTGFMARWTGLYVPTLNGTYNFQAKVSDGVRVTVGTTPVTVIDSWVNHEPAATVGPTAPVNLSAGVAVPITVEYYQNTGVDQISLLVNKPDGTGMYLPVDANSLLPQAQVLPDGWALGIDADGNVGYDYAVIGLNSVTLHDSTGNTHEYKFAGGGFTPPTGEDGHMVRNGDGTITFQDGDGRTYVFNPNGTLKTSTTPVDDRNPAALQYVYGGSPARITQISDAVTQSNPNDPTTATRWLKVLYAGDPNCPSVPTGFTSYSDSRVAGLICAVYTSDGTQTLPVNVANGNVSRFLYTIITHPDLTTVAFLSRVEQPGSAYTDYGPDLDAQSRSLGRIATVRDSLANDAIMAGVRAQDNTELTSIAYDALGHVSSVTLPAATAGASRLSHTYNYYQNYSYEHITGAAEPNGFTRKINYDATYRTTDDIDVANLDTQTQWDPAKDLVLSSIDPAGLKSTTIYDYDNRPTDQYGPAPSAWFGADRKPLTTPTDYTPQVPHTQSVYDGSINGLAATYYDVATYTNGTGQPAKALFGAPKLHGTGINDINGDVAKTWGGTAPFTLDADPAYPPSGKYGWGARLSGFLHTVTSGTYTFRAQSDDGVRLWVDDTLVIDDWADGASRSHGMVAGYTGLANTGDLYHRIRLDYYNKAVSGTPDADATLTLYMTPPGGSETSVLGSLLNPGYGLKTSITSYDSSSAVGNTTNTTSYGANPELGLAQTITVDPGGLNLVTTNTYETQGVAGSFLRQTAKYLPGATVGNTSTATQYSYYSATDTADNPCTSGTVEAYKQAGRPKTTTQPDPDGAGPQTPVTTETIYDDAGRIVASRYNAESWKCTSYDSRGRTTQVVIPSVVLVAGQTAKPARTITYNWAVGGNPLVTSVSDDQGTITSTSDLLGRMTNYVDAKNNATSYSYDNLSRLSTKTSPIGTEGYTYDGLNRLTAQKLGTTTLASPSYDSYGRLSSVTYPTAVSTFPVNTLNATVNRDSLGRTVGYDYATVDPYTATVKHITDNITLSQSSQVVSGTEAGAAKTYTYDKADRLTAATLGTHTFSYSYGTPTICTGNYNPSAGKNSNHTSQTIDGVVTNFCYDYADRLTLDQAGGNTFNGFQYYDVHGNLYKNDYDGANTSTLDYDSSDRPTYVHDMGGSANTVTHDAQDRLLNVVDYGWKNYGYTGPDDTPDFARGNTGSLNETYLQLIGGVLLTTLSSGAQTFSLPNLHGDILATTNGTGTLSGGANYPNNGTFQYTPFGKVISGTPTEPNNMDSSSFAALGQHGRITETGTISQYVFMGARLYDPTFGRFTQVDPVQGGVENNYIYPPDPVNDRDVTGTSKGGRQSGDAPQLSNDEKQALADRAAGKQPNERAYKSAKRKLKAGAKWDGASNAQKRQNDKRESGRGMQRISIGPEAIRTAFYSTAAAIGTAIVAYWWVGLLAL